MLSSPTRDATRVGEWASDTFSVIHSLNTLEEYERYPSQLSRPSGTLGPVDGGGEKAIIVASDEERR